MLRAAAARRNRGSPFRLVPVLRPVRPAQPAEISRVGRVPLEYNFGNSFWARVQVWCRLFLLGPGSPKPAFAVAAVTETWERELESASEGSHGYHGFVHGGYRLEVDLAPGESPRHLIRSVASGRRAWMRTVVVCSPRELARNYPRARYYTVYVAPRREQRAHSPRVILKSADPLFSGRRHDPGRRPDGNLDDVVWLVEIGTDERTDGGLDDHANQRFPKPLFRHAHYGVVCVSLGLLLTVLLSETVNSVLGRVIAHLPEWLQTAIIVIVMLEVLIGAPIAVWSSFRSSLFEFRAGRAGDLRGRKNGGDVTGLESSFSRGWNRWLPWRAPEGGWTASTTDCIVDGFAVRNRPPITRR